MPRVAFATEGRGPPASPARVSEMRNWLDEEFTTGRLIVRDGRADRVGFANRFGFRGGTFITRYPEVRRLFEELDARILQERYLPKETRRELERLEAALGDPVLSKDRRSISLTGLSAATGISAGRLKNSPFDQPIAATQRRIDAEVAASRINPYLHGRVFPFEELSEHLGQRFVTSVAVRFKQLMAAVAGDTAKASHIVLFDMLKWIGTSTDVHCVGVAAEARTTGRVKDADKWEEAVYAYRANLFEKIARGERQHRRVDALIKSLRGAVDGLATAQIVPTLAIPIPGVKNARRKSGRLRSVAEASGSQFSRDTYVDFARMHYASASARIGADPAEAKDFLASLGTELSRLGELSEDPATAIRDLLASRLGTLRAAATEIMESGQACLERGRRLVAEHADIDVAQFERTYLGNSSRSQKREAVRRWFPIGQDARERDRGIANLLKLIGTRFDGVPPASEPMKGYGQFFAKRYREYGGLGELLPMAIPDAGAVAAVLTLYLCEGGANVSVGRTLSRDCIEASALDDHARITGIKARASGKPIIYDIPDDRAAVQGMRWLAEVGTPSCGTAMADSDRLFLIRNGGSMQLATPHWYTAWFKDFAGRLPDLAGILLTPNMIRPSVLLHAALDNDGRLGTGIALGQHGEAVSQGYQQKWPTRLQYDDNIRRFQTTLETLIVSNIPEALAKFGVTADQLERRLHAVRATGLGTFCADPRGRPAGTGSCTTLDCWNDCPHLIVVGEIEALASLQLWQRSLREAEPEWERDHPERWDSVWLPWLCLTDVVEEKMVRGSNIRMWRAATTRADEISSNPAFVAPKPW